MELNEAAADAQPQQEPKQLELKAEPLTAEERIEREREDLLRSIASDDGDTLVHRVAIILNRFPETRDSDVKLQLHFWELYENYDGGAIEPAELFARARLTSLSRARARIQNTYGLFVASPEIRKRRGKLSEEERERALEAVERHPRLTVLMDESGKNAQTLIVASIWFGDSEESFVLLRKLGRWRERVGFQKEMHFKELDDDVEPYYRAAVELVLAEATSVSFKAVSVAREGIKRVDEALAELMYQLLRQGAQHEHDTGRAAFPRTIQVWKDMETKGADKILLAQLRDRVHQAGKVELDGRLTADEFEAVESRHSDLIQIADLFAGSLNRLLNGTGGERVKDRFARWMLSRLGMPDGPSTEVPFGVDSVMHVRL